MLPSEISGLPNLSGYLKLGNLVTLLRVPFITVAKRHPALVPRPVPPTAVQTPAPRAPRLPVDPQGHGLAPAAVPASTSHGYTSFD